MRDDEDVNTEAAVMERLRHLFLGGTRRKRVNAEEYKGEYALLSGIVRDERAMGIMAGVLNFVMFRGIRSLVLLKNSPFLNATPSNLMRLSVKGHRSILLDMIASMGVGFYVFLLILDEQKLAPALATIPLVSGHSRVAEGLCADAIQEYQTTNKPLEFWQGAKSPLMQNFPILVRNCRARHAYERQLRHDLGLRADAPVLIPLPGVPSHYINAVSHDGSDDNNWNDSDNGIHVLERSFENINHIDNDSEWTDAFVTDQEHSK